MLQPVHDARPQCHVNTGFPSEPNGPKLGPYATRLSLSRKRGSSPPGHPKFPLSINTTTQYETGRSDLHGERFFRLVALNLRRTRYKLEVCVPKGVRVSLPVRSNGLHVCACGVLLTHAGGASLNEFLDSCFTFQQGMRVHFILWKTHNPQPATKECVFARFYCDTKRSRERSRIMY